MADFLSLLVYPNDKPRRKKLAGALIVVARNEELKLGNKVPFSIEVLCSLIDTKDAESICIAAYTIINEKRLVAANSFWPTVNAKIRDDLGISRPGKTPLPMSRDMLDAAHKSVIFAKKLMASVSERKARGPKPKAGEIEQNDENIKTRALNDSLPVLHLALALHVELNSGYLAPTIERERKLSFIDLLFDEHAPHRLFSNAEAILKILKSLNKIE